MIGPVFISHSEKDRSFSDMLLSALESRDIRCWIAPRDIPPGGSYAEAIMAAIEDCSCLVLIYTERSNSSGHVLREVERALKFGKNIVPIRFDDSAPSRSLDYLLATVHWLSVNRESMETSIALAAEQVASCVRPVTIQPRPAPAPTVTGRAVPMKDVSVSAPPRRLAPSIPLLVVGIAIALILGLLLIQTFRQTTPANTAPDRVSAKQLPGPAPTSSATSVAAEAIDSRATAPLASPTFPGTTSGTKLPVAANPPARTPALSWDRPRLYLELANNAQRNRAMELKRRLTSSGYVVVTIDDASKNVDVPNEASELRYFTPSDSAEAQRIAQELKPILGNVVAYLPEGMPYVSHSRQYEIWLSQAFR
jgi:hypothetical protein